MNEMQALRAECDSLGIQFVAKPKTADQLRAVI